MNLRFVPADTTPEAARVQLEIFRRMPPSQRLEQALALSETVRRVAASGVRHRHPEYTEEQVRLAVIRLTLGDELFGKAFPGVEIAG